jgi:hypothetical protein
MFTDARSAGVEESGTNAFIAAFASVENGQNALARLGKRAVAPAMPANASMRNCWLNFIGNGWESVGLSNTRMAYILAYISHSLNTSVSVDTKSIAELAEESIVIPPMAVESAFAL